MSGTKQPSSTPPEAQAHDEPFTVTVNGTLGLREIFTEREADLVLRVRAFVPEAGRASDDLRSALDRGLRSLSTVALALATYPSLKVRETLGRRERSFETLMRTLLAGGEHGLEWTLPTKAVLSRTYGIAKVNFFTSLSYVLQGSESPESGPLLQAIAEATEEAVYTRLAEELYASFVTSRMTIGRVKDLAAQHLIDLWDGRVRLATDRFCPMLRSAWAARMRAPRVFGTLMGTAEIVQMLFQDCDERFVAHFSSQGDSEQRQAFEEFLFDLAYENLERVRTRMRDEGKSCVGQREVERYLGLGEGKLRPLFGDPKSLYVSFRRRRVKAQYRNAVGAPGPKRTAEAYVLEALLREEAGIAPDEES